MKTTAEVIELKASFLILRAYVLAVALAEVKAQIQAIGNQEVNEWIERLGK